MPTYHLTGPSCGDSDCFWYCLTWIIQWVTLILAWTIITRNPKVIREEAASPKPHSPNKLHCAERFPPKLSLPMWWSGPNVIGLHGCLGPPNPPPETASGSSQPFFPEFTVEAQALAYLQGSSERSMAAPVLSHCGCCPYTPRSLSILDHV